MLLFERMHQDQEFVSAADVYCCALDPAYQGRVLLLAQKLRDELPSLRIRTHAGGGKLKNQMKRADSSGARVALLVGEDEAGSDAASVKYLREDRPQETLSTEMLSDSLKGYFLL